MSEYLSLEVIGEILKRLPVKSLVRCRSVSKTWNSLVTNPSFISTHLKTSLSKPHTYLLLPWFFDPEDYALHFYNGDFHEFNQLPFPLKGFWSYFQVGGSCNGLVFLWSLFQSGILNLIFWNPSIHKYITLPKPSIGCTNDNAHFIYGFGFDSRINDYKLLMVVVKKIEPLREAYLFSLNENSWKRVTTIIPNYAVNSERQSTFVNGAIHWLGYQRGENGEYCTILGFDISTEEFLVIGLPESLIDFSPCELAVMKYEESSIVLLNSWWEDGEQLDVWVMKEYGTVASWTKVLHFTYQSGRIPRLLGFRQNAQVLLEVDGQMASMELESQQMEHLGIEVREPSFCYSYVETLVLLDKALDILGE